MKNSSFTFDDSKMDNVGFSIGGDSPDSPTLDTRHTSITLFNPPRTHSRSSSWSFNGSTRPGPTDLSSSIASINPIRSVIREFVPSLGTTDERSHTHHPLRRAGSNISLRSINSNNAAMPNNYIVQSRGDSPLVTANSSNSLSSSDNSRDHPHVDHHPQFTGGNGENEEGSIELTDGLKWIEQNTFFFALILIRYAWINKSGMLS